MFAIPGAQWKKFNEADLRLTEIEAGLYIIFGHTTSRRGGSEAVGVQFSFHPFCGTMSIGRMPDIYLKFFGARERELSVRDLRT